MLKRADVFFYLKIKELNSMFSCHGHDEQNTLDSRDWRYIKGEVDDLPLFKDRTPPKMSLAYKDLAKQERREV